ncbi:hypothetical protein HDU86_005350 [Geranomyces michiganensis]|nr:hypothetical protein HDU86_005350 [Geranomyces michiganensis]
MPPKISKNDISHPSPLLTPLHAHHQYTNPSTHSLHKPSTDSAIHLQNHHASSSPTAGAGGAGSPLSPSSSPAIPAFSAGRFDSSASVAGGPLDPKLLKAKLPPPRLSLRQYQSFVQALGVYRRQVEALAKAGETFARALEELADFVPAAQIRRPHVVGDLDFLIDSTHLISNAHQIYAEDLEREFETPLTENLQEIRARTAHTQAENKPRILELVDRLHLEEKQHGLGKKKQRDMNALQSSLNARMSIAEEIKRLTVENQTIHDTLAHASMSYILETSAAGVRAELQTYDTVYEGLKKLGAFADPEGSGGAAAASQQQQQQYANHHHQPTRRGAGAEGRGGSGGGGGMAGYAYQHQQQQQQQQHSSRQQHHGHHHHHHQRALPKVPESGNEDEGTWNGQEGEDDIDMEYVRNAIRNLGGD